MHIKKKNYIYPQLKADFSVKKQTMKWYSGYERCFIFVKF